MNENELGLELEGDELEFDVSEETQTDLPTYPNQKPDERQEATEAKSVAFLLNRLGGKGFDLNIKVLPLPPVEKEKKKGKEERAGQEKEKLPDRLAQVWLGVKVETGLPAFKVVEITTLDDLTAHLNEFVGQYIEQFATSSSKMETKAGADIVTTNSAGLSGKKARQKGIAATTAPVVDSPESTSEASDQASTAEPSPSGQKSGRDEQLSFF
jgi:hypothetical protein